MRQKYPILEFDNTKEAVLEPSRVQAKKDVPKACVITFFREVIQNLFLSRRLEQIGTIHSETVDIPIYKTEINDKEICLVQGYLGSAGAAAQLEELIALGCEKFIVCGGAGVLVKDTNVGQIILPKSAIRDEGASYHYLPPSREVLMNKEAFETIEKELKNRNIPFTISKTWTTDAIFRETRDKIALRIEDGCMAVEMEAAAYFAVAQFREVKLGQILYCGDDLSKEEWDGRKWKDKNIRKNIVELSMDICQKL
jgi:uridine phosphorylase